MAADSGLLRYITEVTVSVVVIEVIPIHPGNEHIRFAIVVVVSRSDTDGISLAGKPGFHGHVAKLEVSFVVEQVVVIETGLFDKGRNRRSVGEEEIDQAVAIVIESGNPASHGFNQVFARGGMIFEFDRKPGQMKANRALGERTALRQEERKKEPAKDAHGIAVNARL